MHLQKIKNAFYKLSIPFPQEVQNAAVLSGALAPQLQQNIARNR